MPEQGLSRTGGDHGGRAVSKAHLVPGGDFTGTVHSVFATACNLEAGGLLLTVHDADAPHTPTSVRVESRGTDPWSPAVRPGDPVLFRRGVLTFGGHVLDLRRLPVWTPAPVPPPADAAAVAGLADEVAATRRRHLRERALPWEEPGAQVAELTAALLAVRATPDPPRGRALRHRGDHQGSEDRVDRTAPLERLDRATGRLIGLGPGLTPAGDDLLVGLLALLNRTGPGLLNVRHPDPPPEHPATAHPPAAGQSSAYRVIARRVGLDAHRTTDISAHYLRLAAAGEFGEPLTRLVDALAGGAARMTVTARTRDVLRTGASSGADAVAGVLLGVRALDPPPVQKAA